MSGELLTYCDDGCALQVIAIDEGKLSLNEKNLRLILNHPDSKNKPIIVVSIVGAFRTGKSFFLTNFIRYLNSKQPHNGTRTFNNEKTGFNWSYGSNSHTKGIWMWNKPLSIHLKNQNKEVCILLMDTQGIFDNETSQNECAAIFSLSAFMSSIQIFNIKNNIEKRDLEYLSIFAQYKTVAQRILKKSFQFEQLTFLIRDWQFPDEHKYGYEGGEDLLTKRLETLKSNMKANKDLNEMLSDLKKYFKKRNCYLMPHPGAYITKKEFNGDLNLLDPDFIKYCNAFYEKTIESIKMDENEHRNDVFNNGENLINMFSEYVKAFECNNFPNLESMTRVYCKHNNLMCKQAEIAFYNKTINKFLSQQHKYMKINNLDDLHTNTLKLCLENYKNYSMDSSDSLYELNELEMSLKSIHLNKKQLAQKQNSAYIDNLKQSACSEYLNEMKLFNSQVLTYLKPIELFLKHEKIKQKCLEEFLSIHEENDELSMEFSELNANLDRILEKFDQENCSKRNQFIEKIKNNCIEIYKKYMEKKLFTKSKYYLDASKFHDLHITATDKCLEKFEELTSQYPDLNMEYEYLLVNDLRGLYSTYFLINYNNKKQTMPEMIYSFFKKPDDLINNKNLSLIRDRLKSTRKQIKNAGWLHAFFIVVSFWIAFVFDCVSFLYNLIFDYDFHFADILNFVFFLFKSIIINFSSMIFHDFSPKLSKNLKNVIF